MCGKDYLYIIEDKGIDLKIKNKIDKYIYIIIPLMLLAVNALILKEIDVDYIIATDDKTTFYIILCILIISPTVGLIFETIGLVKAVRSYRQIDEYVPYSEKRKGRRDIFIFGGTILLTALWFGSMLFIIYQYVCTL